MSECNLDGPLRALFIGGILDGHWIEVSAWQRVHHVLRGDKRAGKYIRRHLAFDRGPAIRVFLWEHLIGHRGIELLVSAYGNMPGCN